MTNSALLEFDSTEEEFARMNLMRPELLESGATNPSVALNQWFHDIALSDEEEDEDEGFED